MRGSTVLAMFSLLVVATLGAQFSVTPDPNGYSLSLGESVTFTIQADPNYPAVSVDISAANVNIAPAVLNFSSAAISQTFTITAQGTQAYSNYVSFVISGDDFFYYYTNPSFYMNLVARALSFAGGYQAGLTPVPVVGESTSSISLSLNPFPNQDVTVWVASDPAGAAVFSRNSFPFTAVVQSLPFTYTPQTVNPFVIYWYFTGTEGAYYANSNTTVTATKRTISATGLTGPFPPVGATSPVITVSLDYLPASTMTITPTSVDGAITFTPPSQQFDATHGVQQFTYAAGSTGSHVVYWALSGSNTAWYNDIVNTTIVTGARTFQITGPAANTAFTVGQTSTPFTVFTQYPPDSSVSVTLTATASCTQVGGGVVLSTNTLNFDRNTLSQSFTVQANSVCNNVAITATVGGANMKLYAAPTGFPAISFTKMNVNLISTDPTQPLYNYLYCGDTITLRLLVNSPPPTGFTVTLTAPGATFSQSSFAFTSTTTSFDFTATISYVTSYAYIQYTITGPDSALVATVSPTIIYSSAKTVTIPTTITSPGVTDLLVGTESSPVQVKVNYPPANSDLTVTAQATGLVFSPPTLPFTSKDTFQSFTVSAAASGSYTVNWAISGQDSACYVLSTQTTTVVVDKLSLQVSAIPQVTVGVQSTPITVSIANLADGVTVTVTPSVMDQYKSPVAAGVYTFTPSSVQLTSATPSATFTYVASAQRSGDSFVFKTDSSSIVADVTVPQAYVATRTFNTPAYLSTTWFGSVRPAFVVVGVPSLPYLVTVANLPPTGVSLRPSAPNTVFTPSVLNFDPNTGAQTFTITTTQGSGPAGTTGTGATAVTITWAVEGTDQNLYSTPGTNSFWANLRSIAIANVGNLTGSPVVYNAPVSFTIDTAYPPESDVIITPYGSGFAFSPSAITLTAGANSVAFTVTPTQVGNNQLVQFAWSGAAADSYYPLQSFALSVSKSQFQVSYPYSPSYPATLVYGGEPYVFQIVANSAPQSDVTVTFYSQQVQFNPASFTFTPTTLATYVEATPVYTPFAPAGTQAYVMIQYALSGTNRNDFAIPNTYTFNTVITGPPRLLTTSGNVQLTPGRSASFFVSSNLPPLTSVTITPTVTADTGYVFTPPSQTISATQTTVLFTVSRTGVAAPAITSVIATLSVSGTDAYLYGDNPGFIINVAGAFININGIYDNIQYKIGTTYPVTVSLNYPPTTGSVIVTPYVITGQPLTFTPSSVSFTAPIVSQVFNIEATSRGGSKIGFQVTGDAALEYAFRDDFDVSVAPATIKTTYTSYLGMGGVTATTNSLTLSTTVDNGLQVTLSAPGFTFSPNPVVFGPGDITQTFTSTATANNLNTWIMSTLSGPDQLNFANPCNLAADCPIASGAGSVSASIGGSGTLQTTVTFSLNRGTAQPLIVTPSIMPPGGSRKRAVLDDSDVMFVPSTVVFSDPSVTTQTVSVYSTTPGSFNLFYSLSGAAAPYYTTQYTDEVANPQLLTFAAPALSVALTSAPALTPGSTSAPIVVYPPTVAPGVTLPTVTITPSATPAGLTFIPPSVTLNQSLPVTFQYTASTAGTFTLSFATSGPGASVFSTIPAQTLTVSTGTFTMPSYTNVFMSPGNAGGVFVVGVSTQYFTVYARSVANNVTLHLNSDSVTFEPNVLFFGKDVHEAEFKFTPTKVGPITITYSVSGADAALFTVPTATTGIRATYKLTISLTDTQTVGAESNPIPISISPAPKDNFVLTVGSNTGSLILNPSKLIFTPGETTKYFTIIPTVTNLPMPAANGISIPGVSVIQSGASVTTLSFQGHDASETGDYTIPIGNPQAVIVGPGWFSVKHPRYQLDVMSAIEFEISSLPRADVTLSLFANNLYFEPPYITFTRYGQKSQIVKVTPRQTTSYEISYTPFKVDYVLSGTNAADYITPSESLHYFAIPMGYIAAIILIPIAIVVILIVLLVGLRKKASS